MFEQRSENSSFLCFFFHVYTPALKEKEVRLHRKCGNDENHVVKLPGHQLEQWVVGNVAHRHSYQHTAKLVSLQ